MFAVSKVLKLLGIKKQQVKLLCVGLDGSGKTTIISQLKGGPVGAPKRVVTKTIVGQENSEDEGEEHHEVEEKVILSPLDQITPTVGFQVEIFPKHSVQFSVFDMSGQGRYRDLWPFFFKDSYGVIFVIDSSDLKRISIVREEVQLLTRHRDLRTKPFLFICNKQDLPDVMSVEQCVELLGLQDEQIEWNIVPTKAIENEGIQEAFGWILDHAIA